MKHGYSPCPTHGSGQEKLQTREHQAGKVRRSIRQGGKCRAAMAKSLLFPSIFSVCLPPPWLPCQPCKQAAPTEKGLEEEQRKWKEDPALTMKRGKGTQEIWQSTETYTGTCKIFTVYCIEDTSWCDMIQQCGCEDWNTAAKLRRAHELWTRLDDTLLNGSS